MAFVQLRCSDHSQDATCAFQRIIDDSPNILSCHNTTGDDDFLLVIVAKDLDDYSAFVDRVLRKLPGVASIRSNPFPKGNEGFQPPPYSTLTVSCISLAGIKSRLACLFPPPAPRKWRKRGAN